MQRVLQADKLHTERCRKGSHEIRHLSKLCPSGSFIFVVLALPVTPTSIQNNKGIILLVLVLLLMVVLVGVAGSAAARAGGAAAGGGSGSAE